MVWKRNLCCIPLNPQISAICQSLHYSANITGNQTNTQIRSFLHYRRGFFPKIRLPKENKVSIRPSVYIVSGYGTEIKWEKETQKDENGSAEIKLEQNMQKVNEDFIARTATRLGIGTEMEYRHPIHSALSAGFRLKGSLEQTTSPQSTLGGGGNFSIVIWL